MVFFMIFFVLLTMLFFFVKKNLLLMLILLEIYSFFLLFLFSFSQFNFIMTDYLVVVFFSVFVMEGVLGLSGLILLVSFSGTDYMKFNNILKW